MRVPWGTLILALLVADAVSLWALFDWLRDGGRGFLESVALVLLYLMLAAFTGFWAIRAGGVSSMQAATRALARNREPTRELLNGLLAFIGGLLIVLPGIASDVVGLALLLPPTRGFARLLLKRRAVVRGGGVTFGGGRERPPEGGPVEIDDYKVE